MENKPKKGDMIIISDETKDGIIKLYYGNINMLHDDAYRLDNIDITNDEIILSLTKVEHTKIEKPFHRSDDYSEKELIKSDGLLLKSFDEFLNYLHETEIKDAVYIKTKRTLIDWLLKRPGKTIRYLKTKEYLLKEEYWTGKQIVSFNLSTPYIITKFENGK